MPHCAGERVDRAARRRAPSTRRCGPGPPRRCVSATTAAPCSRTIGMTRAKRLSGPSPSSKLTQLMTARPPRHSRPASITGGSVESSMIGSVRGGRQAGRRLAHVDGAVAADVVDAQVDQVRALADGLAADVDDLLPVAGEHRLAERLAAVGVGALADHQHAGVLRERHGGVQRGRGRLDDRGARRDRAAADRLDHLAQVLGRRAAAAADQADAVLVDEATPAPRPARPGCSGYSAPCGRAPAGRRWASPTAGRGRAGTGSAGARPSRPDRWRSSCRSRRCRAARARSARRRSPSRAASCRSAPR